MRSSSDMAPPWPERFWLFFFFFFFLFFFFFVVVVDKLVSEPGLLSPRTESSPVIRVGTAFVGLLLALPFRAAAAAAAAADDDDDDDDADDDPLLISPWTIPSSEGLGVALRAPRRAPDAEISRGDFSSLPLAAEATAGSSLSFPSDTMRCLLELDRALRGNTGSVLDVEVATFSELFFLGLPGRRFGGSDSPAAAEATSGFTERASPSSLASSPIVDPLRGRPTRRGAGVPLLESTTPPPSASSLTVLLATLSLRGRPRPRFGGDEASTAGSVFERLALLWRFGYRPPPSEASLPLADRVFVRRLDISSKTTTGEYSLPEVTGLEISTNQKKNRRKRL